MRKFYFWCQLFFGGITEELIYNRITTLHAQLKESPDTPLAKELSTLLETYGFSRIFPEEPGAPLSASKR